MRSLVLALLGTVVSVLTLAACNSNETLLSQNPPKPGQSPATVASPSDNARRITADELHKLWEKNEVLIIDTRAESTYQQEHIKGSISVPTGTLLSRIEEMPRNKMIVAYCT